MYCSTIIVMPCQSFFQILHGMSFLTNISSSLRLVTVPPCPLRAATHIIVQELQLGLYSLFDSIKSGDLQFRKVLVVQTYTMIYLDVDILTHVVNETRMNNC